ncbi:MAG: hypothetical protein COB59_01050 [Rhodospirillaceae bacterium]|nr:MAG: hypothetical protein COB59_01050 [Rhodospirillaceae bacterium]
MCSIRCKFYALVEDGVKVRVRLKPSGRAICTDGVMQNVDGLSVLKATVTQVPENGKANLALIKLLAKEWKLAKSTLQVLQGHTSRNKVLHISGNADQLAKTLQVWAKRKGYADE